MMGSASATGAARAVEAASNALSSPLLEETNIKGAQGILVNVTAGPDLSIGEFGEVGGMIRDMASEDATVVIGTSIDPELKDELRVTMVATGINENAKPQAQAKPSRVAMVTPVAKAVGSSYEPEPEAVAEEPGLVSRNRHSSRSDDLPLFDTDGDSGLDVPTFLRRQAD
jgi:cell division protein FtsZ